MTGLNLTIPGCIGPEKTTVIATLGGIAPVRPDTGLQIHRYLPAFGGRAPPVFRMGIHIRNHITPMLGTLVATA